MPGDGRLRSPRVGHEHRVPLTVLGAAFLFNLGQGVLRPSMPLYLQRTFGANYRMVTLIPVVFGTGKWIANLPTGYLLRRPGRPLMICGLMLIACIDVASFAASRYDVFLGLRAVGGVGWAMFATVATTAMVNVPAAGRRGRAVSLFLMSETSGLLLGSAVGGWLYQGVGIASPFLFEAACMVIAAAVVARWSSLTTEQVSTRRASHGRHLLRAVLSTPGIPLMGVTSAVLVGIQTGVVVFLFPLYLVNRGNVGPEAVGVLLSVTVLGRLVALWLGGDVSDRWGRLRVLIPGLLILALFLGTTVWITHPAVLGVWSLTIGAAAGFVASIPTALASDRVEPALQGMTIAWIRTMSDSGQIIGPLVMGALADAVDLSTPFLFGAALLATMAWQCGRHARDRATATATGGCKS
jgi:MFS family permease